MTAPAWTNPTAILWGLGHKPLAGQWPRTYLYCRRIRAVAGQIDRSHGRRRYYTLRFHRTLKERQYLEGIVVPGAHQNIAKIAGNCRGQKLAAIGSRCSH